VEKIDVAQIGMHDCGVIPRVEGNSVQVTSSAARVVHCRGGWRNVRAA